MSTALEALQVQQPDAAELLQLGASIAIARSMSESGDLVHSVTYDRLSANLAYKVGFVPSGQVKAAFNEAVRQDPLCHGPCRADKVIIGTFPEPEDPLFDSTITTYTNMLLGSLDHFWPAPPYGAVMTHETATHLLGTAHQTGESNPFSLPNLPSFFDKISSKQAGQFVPLAPTYPGPYIVNLNRFAKVSAPRADSVPFEERLELVEQIVANLRAEHPSVAPQTLIYELTQIREAPVRRGQIAEFIARALQIDGVRLEESNRGLRIAFADYTGPPARERRTPESAATTPLTLDEMIRNAHIRGPNQAFRKR